MQIKDIMTRNVKTIHSQALLRDAALAMRTHDVGVLPIVDDGQLVGMLTDRDIVARSTAEGSDPGNQPVEAVMTRTVVHVFEDQDVQEAAWLMEIKRIRRLAVVDGEKRLTGIVTLADLSLNVRDRQLSGEVLEHVSEPGFQPRAGDPSLGLTFSRL